MILEHLTVALSSLLIALSFHWIAWIRHFFPIFDDKPYPPRVTLGHLSFVAMIFFAIYLLFPPIVFSIISRIISASQYTLYSIAQLISLCMFFILYYLYLRKSEFHALRALWKFTTFWKDCGTGLILWLLAFPVVSTVAQLAQVFNLSVFGRLGEEQVAILHLKRAMENPFSLIVIIGYITIVAPLLEEYLFRGLFFNYLRARMNFKASVVISSIAFSIMHYAPSQGIGNIPLLCSLFTLSLYLGYAYERNRSLFAPITLHFAFNLISTIRILLI